MSYCSSSALKVVRLTWKMTLLRRIKIDAFFINHRIRSSLNTFNLQLPAEHLLSPDAVNTHNCSKPRSPQYGHSDQNQCPTLLEAGRLGIEFTRT